MLNDDYTPMEFVVLVLQRFFSMGVEDATRVMLRSTSKASPSAASSPYEVAETKVSQVIDFRARKPASASVHVGEGLSGHSCQRGANR
jgi:ATP-dependent Clp protease adapter protein ClpS